MRILLTAFDGSRNSSNAVMKGINCGNVEKLCLPNDFDGAADQLVSATQSGQPDYVIAMGRKPRIKRLFIEPAAVKNGERLETNFDISQLTMCLNARQIPFAIAEKPSNFLCNHIYFCGLRYLKEHGMNTKMIFLHTPDFGNWQDMDLLICGLNDFCRAL